MSDQDKIKENAKNAVKAAAKETGKGSSKGSTKSAAKVTEKTAAKSAAKAAEKEAAKSMAKAAEKEAAKSIMKTADKEAAPAEAQTVDYFDPAYYTNRELSWMDFNIRILEEARDRENPLFERLKFLGITASNLDEFFMVRVASLKDMVHAKYTKKDIAGMTAADQLREISPKAHKLVAQQYSTYNRSLLPSLKSQKLELVTSHEELTPSQAAFTDSYFEENVYPVLTPMAMDSARPFPLVRNKSLNIGALISYRGDSENAKYIEKEMEKEGMDYPLHLGVTEAGEGEDGRLKSAVGIGALLIDGIGDTIRVSLSEEPECEIPVAQSILQAARVQMHKPEFISCPGCGRTLYDLQDTIRRVKAAIKEKAEADARYRTLKIGIMGCIVNGPGEMADADYGYVGAARGKGSLYKNKVCVEKNIPEAEAIERLIAFIDKDLKIG